MSASVRTPEKRMHVPPADPAPRRKGRPPVPARADAGPSGAGQPLRMPSLLRDGDPARIAVFRALQLGDMLCTVPALRALRRALPDARVTLIGLASARSFVERFGRYVDDLIEFPGIAAFPEQPAREDLLPAFFAATRARRFDVALQMHGSGARSNDIVRRLGAREWGGFVPEPGLQRPGRRMAWPDDLPEPMRYTALIEFLGVPAEDADLEFPLTDADRREAARLADALGLAPERTIFVHPGARLPSRRWPVERFAAVAGTLGRQGWPIAVTGGEEERGLAAGVVQALGGRAFDLSGRTSLTVLAALVERARLLICNDTGISHVAAALRTPSVVIASGSDVDRWAPLDRTLHSVLFEPTLCRPCAYAVCPIGHPCALGVTPESVMARAQAHLMKEHVRA